MSQISRIIFMKAAGISYAEFPLNGHLQLAGILPEYGNSCLGHALTLFHEGTIISGAPELNTAILAQLFPTESSRLIYEVGGTAGVFTTHIQREKGELSFWFAQGEYDDQLYKSVDGTPKSTQSIRKQLKQLGIRCSELIRTRGTYLDILKGVSNESALDSFQYSSKETNGIHHLLSSPFQPQSLCSKTQSWIELGLDAKNPTPLKGLKQALAPIAAFKEDWDLLHNQIPALEETWETQQMANEQKRAIEELQKTLSAQFAYLEERFGQMEFVDESIQIESPYRQQLSDCQQQIQQAQEKLIIIRHEQVKLLRENPQSAQWERFSQALPGMIDQLTHLIGHYHKEVSKLDSTQQVSELNSGYEGVEATLTRIHDREIASLRQKQVVQDIQRSIEELRKEQGQAIQAIHGEQQNAEQVWIAQKQLLEEKRDLISNQVHAYSRTFQDWLEQTVPDWEQTIGKVVKPEVLSHPYLAPKLERITPLLFGIELDLSELPLPNLSELKNLESQDAIERQLMELDKEWISASQAFKRKSQQVERKFRIKLKELNKELKIAQNHAEQLHLQTLRLRHHHRENLALAHQISSSRKQKFQLHVQAGREERSSAFQEITQHLSAMQELLAFSSSSHDTSDPKAPSYHLEMEEKMAMQTLAFWQDRHSQITLQQNEWTENQTDNQLLQTSEQGEWDALKIRFAELKIVRRQGQSTEETSLEAFKDKLEQLEILVGRQELLTSSLTESLMGLLGRFRQDNIWHIPTSPESWLDFWEVNGHKLLDETYRQSVLDTLAPELASCIPNCKQSLEYWQKGLSEIDELIGRYNHTMNLRFVGRHIPFIKRTTKPESWIANLETLWAFIASNEDQLGGQNLFSDGSSDGLNHRALDCMLNAYQSIEPLDLGLIEWKGTYSLEVGLQGEQCVPFSQFVDRYSFHNWDFSLKGWWEFSKMIWMEIIEHSETKLPVTCSEIQQLPPREINQLVSLANHYDLILVCESLYPIASMEKTAIYLLHPSQESAVQVLPILQPTSDAA
ncbi:ATP-binding protein [Pontibacter sp. G13]|uniref:ATP-binding protein n=1 Tax=Pontibacter sp. G13 TaxID=3074898 RepID=UPI00288B03A7|nr:ATP-binding protein [Pontibacter sp. G13]WNJ21461.1 ATP-binding protein [Pontibacter sp. G13]